MIPSWLWISIISIVIGVFLIIIDNAIENRKRRELARDILHVYSNKVCELSISADINDFGENEVECLVHCEISNNCGIPLTNLNLYVGANAPTAGDNLVWNQTNVYLGNCPKGYKRTIDVPLNVPSGTVTSFFALLSGNEIENLRVSTAAVNT